jgi:flap endonuclease-1
MGIARLNRFIQKRCPQCLHKINLETLSGKVLAIDTSIYLYKFKAKGSLITQMYLMCSLFKYYNIKPIFVFDGKPPPEKQAVINMRREKKKAAEREHKKIAHNLLSTTNKYKRQGLKHKLDKLAKKFIRIKNSEIRDIKMLFSSYGISYIEAVGEADRWCAKLVSSGYAYACVSEDMDMFAYGCPLVLRYLNLVNRTAVLYDLHKILAKLSLPLGDFRSLCILSGSDYNYDSSAYVKPIGYYYYRLKRYKSTNLTRGDFYNWLYDREVIPLSKDNYCKARTLFNNASLIITPQDIRTHSPQPKKLMDILRKENFIFPPVQ